MLVKKFAKLSSNAYIYTYILCPYYMHWDNKPDGRIPCANILLNEWVQT